MGHQEAVMEKINLVYDPELDKSVLEMNFIEEVKIQGTDVNVAMRLPTYWCSPNFAFIMAEDIRDRVMEIPWVKKVIINLKDHSASEEINKGVTEGKSFKEVFTHLASNDLKEVRKKFQIKSFISRQEKLLRSLINYGMEKNMLNLTVKELNAHPAITDRSVLNRYLILRNELGFSNDPYDQAFIKPTGESIDPKEFSDYLLEARRTRMSMEFNSTYCRGLLDARYQTVLAKKGE
ncbi:iron-sulfur cluster assembly protein [Fictibacillus sp. WQ 8-8]|uniref:iron-sulfur cluster assembly protein n=1 Tax=Fictibacillus sp. WQ 8-8 TaxID=2938788 RepID=UPI0021089B4F|nr:iron-sulfur cluster assembly protein [Fictibacillus sp. WQ 8-8]MCQ6267785.1 iron-sulfur cluster assembly protein [Fictibacillus sp. WQ 8-8]